MIRTSAVACCLCLVMSMPVASAPAQTPPAPPDAETAPPEHDRAIVGGKRLQPHTAPGEGAQSPEAELRLLRRGAREAPSNEPVVVPRDLYGNPLGGDPGLNPPGREPPPKP